MSASWQRWETARDMSAPELVPPMMKPLAGSIPSLLTFLAACFTQHAIFLCG